MEVWAGEAAEGSRRAEFVGLCFEGVKMEERGGIGEPSLTSADRRRRETLPPRSQHTLTTHTHTNHTTLLSPPQEGPLSTHSQFAIRDSRFASHFTTIHSHSQNNTKYNSQIHIHIITITISHLTFTFSLYNPKIPIPSIFLFL